jgi:hypothetical protein
LLLTEERLGFHDASVSFARSDQTFSTRLLVEPPVAWGRGLTDLDGRWMTRSELAITAIAGRHLLR